MAGVNKDLLAPLPGAAGLLRVIDAVSVRIRVRFTLARRLPAVDFIVMHGGRIAKGRPLQEDGLFLAAWFRLHFLGRGAAVLPLAESENLRP